jgi:hypothetical protein
MYTHPVFSVLALKSTIHKILYHTHEMLPVQCQYNRSVLLFRLFHTVAFQKVPNSDSYITMTYVDGLWIPANDESLIFVWRISESA